MEINCSICDGSLDEGETVNVSSGLSTLIKASNARKDDLHKNWAGKSSVQLHVQCRKSYTRMCSIKADEKHLEPAASTSKDISPVTLRSTNSNFCFGSHCLFCGKNLITNSKNPLKKSKQVSQIVDHNTVGSILSVAYSRKDDWGATVIGRINGVSDVIAAQACYHPECYASFYHVKKFRSTGRPKSETLEKWNNSIITFLETTDDCQHSFADLMERFPLNGEIGQRHAINSLKAALKDKFGHRIIFPKNTKIPLLCLVDSLEMSFPEKWGIKRDFDEQEENSRIVQAAAKILRSEIQRFTYESKNFPSAESIKGGGKESIPELLLNFITYMTSKQKKNENSDENPHLLRKQINICHSLISICRPRTFLSPIHCALGLYVSRTYGSRHLIDVLHNLGVCTSYHDVNTYEMSLMSEGPPIENECAFQQFVFDNADYNVRTLSGRDTFHVLGGIKCITPASAVVTSPVVPKVKTGMIDGSFNIPVIQYVYDQKHQGLRNTIVQKFSDSMEVNFFKFKIHPHNMLYISGLSNINHQSFLGWHGFMSQIFHKKSEFETSYIMALPFINVDPTNMTAIYSALLFASKEGEKVKKKCFVTFDQPLFHKASIILANKIEELPNVIVRLGGFHLLMSFLGCLGKFMEGSGIEELLSAVYGSATVPHILNGHAYYRSVRAHMLIQAALMLVLIEKEPELKSKLENLAMLTKDILKSKTPNCKSTKQTSVDENSVNLQPLLTSSENNEVMSVLSQKFDEVAKSNRTAKLWLQEFILVDLLFKYIFAERAGDWNLHLNTVKEMLPFFHAAGHFNYAKSAHLYLQQMQDLEFKLPAEEFTKFTQNGFFTLRRTEKFFSGTWTDMCIEQTLMRSMKAVGGLTHGRGLSEKTIYKFISCGPRFLHVKEAFLKFVGITAKYNEQHVELRDSRKNIDLRDLHKLKSWFDTYSPFAQEDGSLVCLATGLVANNQVNCDSALEVGLKLMKTIENKKFEEIVLHRKDMVKTIGMAKNKVTLNTHDVTVTAEHLFNRSILLAKGGDLKKYFKYEMTPYPTSLFQNALMMRKGKKSDFMEVFKPGKIPPESCPQATLYVVDGGYLLHAVIWPKNATFRDIIANYISYFLRNFGERSHVVFDGYPEESTTKNIEHLRRGRNTSVKINFTLDMLCVQRQNEFLNNTHNKKKLIAILSYELRNHGVFALVAEADADREIVVQAMLVSSNSRSSVTVIGTDTDLLVLLVGLSHDAAPHLYFQKPGCQKVATQTYSVRAIKQKLDDLCSLVFFAYAVTGCDTTSILHGKGKMKGYNLLATDTDLRNSVSVFTKKSATREEIKNAGEKFLLKLYGGSSVPKVSTLDELRHTIYIRKMSKMSLKSKFDIGLLPPTSSAAEQHCLRVFHQVQAWVGNQLPPQDWGWDLNEENILQPRHSNLPPVPADIVKSIACKCKSKCTNRCSCVKNKIKCSDLCHFCLGTSCSNSDVMDIEDMEFEETLDPV